MIKDLAFLICISMCCVCGGPAVDPMSAIPAFSVKLLRLRGGSAISDAKSLDGRGQPFFASLTQQDCAGKHSMAKIMQISPTKLAHNVLRLRGGVRKVKERSFDFMGAGGEKVTVGEDGVVKGAGQVSSLSVIFPASVKRFRCF
jgi:hypothetical protein